MKEIMENFILQMKIWGFQRKTKVNNNAESYFVGTAVNQKGAYKSLKGCGFSRDSVTDFVENIVFE